MTIERLNLPGGETIPSELNVYDFAAQLVVQRADEIETLQPGDYELPTTRRGKDTPQLLTVFDNGTGMVRMIPGTKRLLHGSPDNLTRIKDQGKAVYLPADSARICVANRTRLLGRERLLDIVLWQPNDEPTEDPMSAELRKILAGSPELQKA